LASAAALVVVLGLSACAGRPNGNLVAVAASAPGASAVEMLVATTRSDEGVPPAVMFNGERGIGLRFADMAIFHPARRVAPGRRGAMAPFDPRRSRA
jgi:esterase/lipase superfamily enzyme